VTKQKLEEEEVCKW